MNDWTVFALNQVAEIVGGGTPSTNKDEYWNGHIPWITPKDLSNHKSIYISRGERSITQQGLDHSSAKLLPASSVLLSSRAPIGYLAISENRLSTNQGFRSLIPNERTTSLFLFYLLKANKDYLELHGSGSTFKEISGSTLGSLEFAFPPLPEQRAIAGVLSSLDDKIDLLHRENETLEALAETLFRQWFIEEAEDDWEKCALSETIEIVGGGTPRTTEDSYWNGGIPWLSGGDIASSHKDFLITSSKTISELGLDNSSANILPKYASVITARGTVGKICMLGKDMAFSQTNYGILPRFENCYFFTYLLLNYWLSELLSAAYGSVFDTITRRTFEELIVFLPTKPRIMDFEQFIKPLFQKMFINKRHSQTLKKLRDTLLPKMMCGEVRVKY
jgi:type I restriction enzyme S subunit